MAQAAPVVASLLVGNAPGADAAISSTEPNIAGPGQLDNTYFSKLTLPQFLALGIPDEQRHHAWRLRRRQALFPGRGISYSEIAGNILGEIDVAYDLASKGYPESIIEISQDPLMNKADQLYLDMSTAPGGWASQRNRQIAAECLTADLQEREAHAVIDRVVDANDRHYKGDDTALWGLRVEVDGDPIIGMALEFYNRRINKWSPDFNQQIEEGVSYIKRNIDDEEEKYLTDSAKINQSFVYERYFQSVRERAEVENSLEKLDETPTGAPIAEAIRKSDTPVFLNCPQEKISEGTGGYFSPRFNDIHICLNSPQMVNRHDITILAHEGIHAINSRWGFVYTYLPHGGDRYLAESYTALEEGRAYLVEQRIAHEEQAQEDTSSDNKLIPVGNPNRTNLYEETLLRPGNFEENYRKAEITRGVRVLNSHLYQSTVDFMMAYKGPALVGQRTITTAQVDALRAAQERYKGLEIFGKYGLAPYHTTINYPNDAIGHCRVVLTDAQTNGDVKGAMHECGLDLAGARLGLGDHCSLEGKTPAGIEAQEAACQQLGDVTQAEERLKNAGSFDDISHTMDDLEARINNPTRPSVNQQRQAAFHLSH